MSKETLTAWQRRQSLIPAAAGMAIPTCAWAVRAIGGVPAGWTVAAGAASCGALLVFIRRRATAWAVELHRKLSVHTTWTLEWPAHYQHIAENGQDKLTALLKQIEQGDSPTAPEPVEAASLASEPFTAFATYLKQVLYRAQEAVIEVATRTQPGLGAEGAALIQLANRTHSSATRAITLMDELERNTEDPDDLQKLYGIDHQLTQICRRAGSVLVLCDSMVMRGGNTSIVLWDVLRGAIAQVEKYGRAEVAKEPPTIYILGYVVRDVMALLAELIDNATKFSSSSVAVTAELLPAGGLVVEVEDRGLSMSPQRLQEANRLLAEPTATHLHARLADGRIGLSVAAKLAKRRGIQVELRTNIVGGTKALIALPEKLLDTAGPEEPTNTARGTTVSHTDAPPAEHDPSAGQRPAHAPGPAPTLPAAASKPTASDGRRPLPRRPRADQHVDLGNPTLPEAPALADSTTPGFASFLKSFDQGEKAPTTNPPPSRPAD